MQYYIVQCKGVENTEKEKRAINYCCAVDGDRFAIYPKQQGEKKKFLFFALLT